MDALIQDFRLALRSLARNPGMSLAAILTLALGIGANTAMFGVIDSIFFRPPAHIVDPGRVIKIFASPGSVRTWPRFQQFKQQSHTMAVAAYFGPRAVSLGQGSEAREVKASLASANFFKVLGVTPRTGRFFTDEEDRPGSGAAVALISEEYWKRELGGTQTALGSKLRVGDQMVTVIGVVPERFTGVGRTLSDIWLPMAVSGPSMLWKNVLDCETCSWLQLIGKLSPGITPEQATSELTTLFKGNLAQPSDSSTRIKLVSMQEVMGTDAVRGVTLSTWLAAACGIVLLIACVNVANLLLTRATRRQREMAVRLALGSRRTHLVRQLYIESGILALLGGTAALLVTLWTGPVLQALLLADTAAEPIDLRVLGFTFAVASLTTLLAGLAPALYSTRPDLVTALKAGAREGGGARSWLQSGLLIGQIAMTVTLLTGAALFIRSLRGVEGLRLGFDPQYVTVIDGNLAPIRSTPQAISAEFERMRERVSHVPGVTGTTLSIGFPFRYNFGVGFTAPGLDSLPSMDGPYLSAVMPDYFATMGTRVLRGRGFTEADQAGSQRVMVIGEITARTIWPDKDALGQCLIINAQQDACRQVVGIVEDGRQNRIMDPAAQVFIPLAQADTGAMNSPVTSLVVRTREDAEQALPALREAIQSTSADLPYMNIQPMGYLFADEVRPWQLGAILFSLFGGLALLLGAVGVYGVLSYAMSQRTHELGVRMALGAQRERLLGMVIGKGVQIALSGVLIGAGGALLAGKALASLVYGVSPYDPLNLLIVGVILVFVAVLASLIPAWRVSRVDPMVALRAE